MTYTLYGIKNCDTVQKARKWLEQHGITHRFHDFRVDGLDEKRLDRWLNTQGWEAVVNRRSTSWKALAAEDRAAMDRELARRCILEAPTLIKRPVLEDNGTGEVLAVGFKDALYEDLLA